MNSDCILWTGGVARDGYGLKTVGSRTDGTRRMQAAHRWAWEQVHGPIPDGLVVDHLCGVRLCINPDHLEPVTPRENVRRTGHGSETHCKHGHSLADAYVQKDGRRQCATCSRSHSREYQRRRRATARAS